MRNVEITICGRRALVEAAHVGIFLKKQALIAEAQALRKAGHEEAVIRVVAKIGRLHRKMQREGIFCQIID